ncbi:hypothetical protein F9V18_23565 [Escherichia coli]|nr:hypothetical protein [Escherichia coli]
MKLAGIHHITIRPDFGQTLVGTTLTAHRYSIIADSEYGLSICTGGGFTPVQYTTTECRLICANAHK